MIDLYQPARYDDFSVRRGHSALLNYHYALMEQRQQQLLNNPFAGPIEWPQKPRTVRSDEPT